mgnify:CR=1 FL=1
MIILIILVVAHMYFKPKVDIEDDIVIIHYWWRGVRKTYIL